MLVQSMELDTNIISLSSLLGVRGYQEVLQSINQTSGGSYYGSESDPYREGFQNFITNVVEPVRQAGMAIYNTARELIIRDEIRCINSVAELKKGIPPKMQLPIVYYEPIRTMLDDGDIDGFGIDPSKLAKDDPYKELCEAGTVSFTAEELPDDGSYVQEVVWDSTWPDLTPEEAMNLQMTREFIDTFLKDEVTKYLDPTNYPHLHG